MKRYHMLVGWQRRGVVLRIIMHVWFHLTCQCLRGRFPLTRYFVVLKRALVFLGALKDNKIVRTGSRYKLHLYVPAYPSPAFFHSLEKFYRPDPGPLTVVFSMTRACTYACKHCYQKRDRGADLSEAQMVSTASAMQDMGVSMFDIEGGEPLQLPDRLLHLISHLDQRAEIWINTTGTGLTDDLASQLRSAGLYGVMISIHSPDAHIHDDFVGVPGAFDVACAAAQCFARQGIVTALNTCPSAEDILSGQCDRIMALGYKLGCAYVQMIHRKPSGAWLDNMSCSPRDPKVLDAMVEAHLRYNHDAGLREYPSLSAQAFEERAALFGCTAGGIDRFYFGADGEVQPCEFLNVSFGNVHSEPFEKVFARMREHFQVPGCHWLCCTMAPAISAMIQKNGLTRTPVPWAILKEQIDSWDRGNTPQVYRRLGIYKEEQR